MTNTRTHIAHEKTSHSNGVSVVQLFAEQMSHIGASDNDIKLIFNGSIHLENDMFQLTK